MKISTTFFLLLLSGVALTVVSAGEACQAKWQCQQFSENYNYADCVDGECQCLSDSGFDGDATQENKCHCDSSLGRQVQWTPSGPICLSFEEALQNVKDKERNALLRSQVERIYTSLLWPTPYAIVTNLEQGDASLLADLFAQDAHGRVDPPGTFDGFEGIVEYFYGSVWLPFSHVNSVVIHQILVEGDYASVRVDILVHNIDPASETLLAAINLTQTGIFRFNEQNLVQGAEVVIHRLGKASDANFPPGAAFDQLVCGLALTPAPNGAGCTAEHDPDGFFVDFADCLAFMASIDRGTFSDIPMNSVVCRYYHALLAIANPAVHCSHVGKTGGGKCYDHTYEEYFKKNYLN
eukprot:CAMPEP_0174229794 /NCGR_PEP_ID=MMETSP0417-20130205/672_1 /TAXON_ID=242541 /ORGANISM="Mayorella sp, Strain BSH-02190019" /LENGTH=350 /DNA_ID=CAMNT_0015307379 /DNA_START=183 /DNA_END=1235 /DNA_ORIENTATION=-